MKNSNPSHLTRGKFSDQMESNFAKILQVKKLISAKKRSEMEDSQQRLPFFLRIHAHSGKYPIKKSNKEIFCQIPEH